MSQQRFIPVFRCVLMASLALVPALVWSAADAPAMSSFRQMDADGNGKVTDREHLTAARRMFEAMDADRDGRVNAAEMDAAQAAVTGKPQSAKPASMSAADKIKAIDSDGDGVLTEAEHAAGAKKMFAAMDSNHDGVLSQREMAAGHARLLKEPRKP